MYTDKEGCKARLCAVHNFFSLYSQVIMDGLVKLMGLRVGRKNINNIRYADNTVLIADSE